MKRGRAKRWFAVGLASVACLAALAASQRRASRESEALQRALVSVPIGATAADAEQLLGGPPDRTSSERGVITEHFTFLPTVNSRSTGYGPPQEYEMRLWERGSTTGVIFVDRNGLVAGKHLVRPTPASQPGMAARLRAWIRQVLPLGVVGALAR